MNRTMLLAGSVLALMTVTGCNTIAGIGKDLQVAGSAISETSDEVRDAVTNSDGTTRTATACDEPAGRSTRSNCR